MSSDQQALPRPPDEDSEYHRRVFEDCVFPHPDIADQASSYLTFMMTYPGPERHREFPAYVVVCEEEFRARRSRLSHEQASTRDDIPYLRSNSSSSISINLMTRGRRWSGSSFNSSGIEASAMGSSSNVSIADVGIFQSFSYGTLPRSASEEMSLSATGDSTTTFVLSLENDNSRDSGFDITRNSEDGALRDDMDENVNYVPEADVGEDEE